MSKLALATGGPFDFQMPAHIQDAFTQALAARPDGCFILVDTQGGETQISYAELWDIAQAMLAGLQQAGCKTGDTIILDAGNVAQFIPALWAVIVGGMVAVPLARSGWNANAAKQFSDRLAWLKQQLGNPVIISSDPAFAPTHAYNELRETAIKAAMPRTDASMPAVLISTSGTTGRSQLVTLSAHAIMHRWWPANPSVAADVTFLGWTPLDHVMGLGMAAPNYLKKIHLPAELFVRQPSQWLALIEKHHVTHSVMTNFSMKLLTDSMSEAAAWNLSSIRRIGVGAETIVPQVCAGFVKKLVALGMPDDAVILGYGLSECGPVAGGQRSFTLADLASGHAPLMIDLPTKGHAIRIVDEQGKIGDEGTPGRIEVRGETMTSGYYNDAQANTHLFTPDGWLRTGDLGYLREGCLCVTGREKETLSINARKFSCNEIDAAIASLPGIRFAHVFAMADGAGVSLVFGAADSEIEKNIRTLCAQTFGFGLVQCVAVQESQLPRTHSGKLQRHKLPELLAPSLQAEAPMANATREEKICAIMSRFLSGIHPKADDNFFALGGDSLGALMFTVAVEKELKVSLPPAVFTRSPTCRAIAQYIETTPVSSGRLAIVPVQKGTGGDAVFLMPGIWGNNAYASQMAEDMGADISVWTFHLTDPENRNAQMNTLHEFAAECYLLMRQVRPHGPYHLAGHSFGGLLAYEVARCLIEDGQQLASLSIIDACPRLGERSFGAAHAGLDSEDGLLVRYYRHLANVYLPQELDCRLRYYRAKDSQFMVLSDPSAGWSYLALQGVDVFDIPGDHHSVVRAASRMKIAASLREAIADKNSGVFCLPVAISSPARALISQAMQASLAGDYEAETTMLTHAMAQEAHLPYWVYMHAAKAFFDKERIEEATQAYKLAVAHDPLPLTTYAQFAAYLRQHDLKALAREALIAVRHLPVANVATAYMMACLYAALGSTEETLKNLHAGLAMTPDSLDLCLMLVRVYVGMGNHSGAKSEIQKALEHKQENDTAFVRLGEGAISIHEHELAIACFNQVLAINPRNIDAYIHLGAIAKARGDTLEAREWMAKATQIQHGIRFNSE